MIPVTIHGAEGRMGRLVTALVDQATDCELVALISEPGRDEPAGAFHPRLPLTGQDRLAQVHVPGGVIVDFSVATALDGLLAGATETRACLVVGTTGHSPAQLDALRAYAEQHPVVLAANFSLGIPALQLMLEQLARVLPQEFAAEEIEIHHRFKRDKPSGTALHLARAWQEQREVGEIPIHSLRLGGVVGEHSWLICDDEETLQLSHRAHSRHAFLRGVLPAVRFVVRRSQGIHGLKEVLSAAAAQD